MYCHWLEHCIDGTSYKFLRSVDRSDEVLLISACTKEFLEQSTTKYLKVSTICNLLCTCADAEYKKLWWWWYAVVNCNVWRVCSVHWPGLHFDGAGCRLARIIKINTTICIFVFVLVFVFFVFVHCALAETAGCRLPRIIKINTTIPGWIEDVLWDEVLYNAPAKSATQ